MLYIYLFTVFFCFQLCAMNDDNDIFEMEEDWKTSSNVQDLQNQQALNSIKSKKKNLLKSNPLTKSSSNLAISPTEKEKEGLRIAKNRSIIKFVVQNCLEEKKLSVPHYYRDVDDFVTKFFSADLKSPKEITESEKTTIRHKVMKEATPPSTLYFQS